MAFLGERSLLISPKSKYRISWEKWNVKDSGKSGLWRGCLIFLDMGRSSVFTRLPKSSHRKRLQRPFSSRPWLDALSLQEVELCSVSPGLSMLGGAGSPGCQLSGFFSILYCHSPELMAERAFVISGKSSGSLFVNLG